MLYSIKNQDFSKNINLFFFLNNLSESNSQLLKNILENMHIQPFIGFSRCITSNLVSLYKYECCNRDCYVCNTINS